MLSHKSFPQPVVGFWCWALGYLDPALKTIGCLLHPSRHEGVDLRFLTGYGAKCARELCYEAHQFDRLSDAAQLFWLELARGLNSFYFSSPRANPLFHLLRWGPTVLEGVKLLSSKKSWSATEAIWHLDFLLRNDLEPRAWRLAVEMAFERTAYREEFENLPWEGFFSGIQIQMMEMLRAGFSSPSNGPYVHTLDVDESLQDFVRFFLGISRMNFSRVRELGDMLTSVVGDVLDGLVRWQKGHF